MAEAAESIGYVHPAPTSPFASAPPTVQLVNTFGDPLDNAIATARTCYNSRIITVDDVRKDDRARALRDRIARDTYTAGHHTTLQHAHFQFTLDNVSRQFLWSFLHAHPFYNSEQVSQRYVEVKPDKTLIPVLPRSEDLIYRGAVERQMETYHRLIELLTPVAGAEFYRIFPARRNHPEKYGIQVKKKAQEIARYILPVATFAHLYHTIAGITLHRYHRLCNQMDVPTEQAAVVAAMVAEVDRVDPLFFRDIEDPIPLEDTLEFQMMAERQMRAGGAAARGFRDEFDQSLGDLRSKLIDYKVNAEATLAQAVRSVLGIPRAGLPDDDAIQSVLAPDKNPIYGESLVLTTMSKLTRTLSHVHYTFRKKISHTADSQDQRHRMVPGSRPVLFSQYVGGEPDAIVPELIARSPEALDLYQSCLLDTWRAIDELLSAGVSPEWALYLLPNAFPIRFEESGDLLHLHHKWTGRLCYAAQEEIWRASVEEVTQVREVHPRLGVHMMPPCQLRDLAGIRPFCSEGARYCGVPVWKVPLEDFERLI
jgi:thymidylate synthase ThyX